MAPLMSGLRKTPPPPLKSLRANLASLKITRDFALEDRGTMPLLQRLTRLSQPIDLVFLDPPYDAEEAYTQTLGFLGAAANRTLLAPDALVITEHATKSVFQPAEHYGALTQTRRYKQGDASLAFYSAQNPGAPPSRS